jgi:hypothetical protein
MLVQNSLGTHHRLVAAAPTEGLRPRPESGAALYSYRSPHLPRNPDEPHLAIPAAVFDAEGAATSVGKGSGGVQWGVGGGSRGFEVGWRLSAACKGTGGG